MGLNRRHTMRPSYFDPCLPVLGRTLPKGPDWVHQPKMDGYRCLVAKIGQRVRLYSKNGTEWSDQLPGLVEVFAALQTDFIVDGELCVCDDRGRPNFRALHAEMRQRRPDTSRMTYFAFDLLFDRDVDLRPLPLSERQRDLARLLRHGPQGGALPLPRRVISSGRAAARVVRALPARRHRFEAIAL